MDPLALGDRRFVEEDYEAAVQCYTEAIKQDSSAARAYEARAKAYIELEDFTAAAEDAAKAIELEPGLSKAYLRKGIACFHLEEYESAKDAFDTGLQLAPSSNDFKKWIKKCQAELAEEEESAAPTRPAAASQPQPQAPPPPQPVVQAPLSSPSQAPPSQQPVGPQPTSAQPGTTSSNEAPLAPCAPPSHEGKYRYQWYQVNDRITLDVYAKNLKPEQVVHQYTDTSLQLKIVSSEGESEYELDFILADKVIPSACKCTVLKTKVEMSMKKEQNLHWASLDKDKKMAASGVTSSGAGAVDLGYPSSYKKQPKDWNAVESELSELEKKGELDFGDPLNNFFKKIYGQGDDDQRRAMMKSFVESGGTVLSTNWSEVGSKKVDCTPPDGMEVKKWEQ